MSLSPLVAGRVADLLLEDIKDTAQGHCVRVDDLSPDDAAALCLLLRKAAKDHEIKAFVLTPSGDGAIGILPEQAIEIRNRKQTRLCLFVPSGVEDAAVSSLQNSFAEFNLNGSLAAICSELSDGLPDEVRTAVKQALAVARRQGRLTNEAAVDYVGAVAEDGTEESAGRELWRLELIPDSGGPEMIDRLRNNSRCVRLLARPARPHASVIDRVDSLGLRKGGVKDDLLAFLTGRKLADARSWLKELSDDLYRERLAFERWMFEAGEASDLEAIVVDPLLDSEGRVQSYTGLRQANIGEQASAPVGARRKVTVRWKSSPKSPSNLMKWAVELIPSRDEYTVDDAASVDFPSLRTGGKTRRASLVLDIDLENVTTRAVQVRVAALDQYGTFSPIRKG